MRNDSIIPRGEQTRSAILQAALHLFLRQGFHGTSMRQIAAEAEIALGGIYNHFANKEEIFQTLYNEGHPYREALPALMQASGDTIEEVLQDAARRMLAALEHRPDFLRLTFIEILEFQSAHLPELFAEIYPAMIAVIERIQTAYPGELRSIPSPMLVRSFIGLFVSFYITEMIFVANTRIPQGFRENALNIFLDIYMNGVLKKGEV